jgi:hypothetical protein
MTIPDFDDVLAPPPPGGEFHELLRVIYDFVKSLTGTARVGAKTHGKSPIYLKIYPEHRPSRGADILSFHVKPTGIQVRIEPLRIDSTPEALRESLVSFAKTDAFQETLQNLRDAAKHSVEAILDGESRVYVEVTAEDQEKLGKTEEGNEVELTVKRIALTGNGKMPANPAKLFSAGLVATVTSATPVQDDPDVLALKVKKEKDAD